jgi:hypothetical protein
METVTDPGACSTSAMPNLIISQYVETNSGTTPKGVEIWNNSTATADFSSNSLVIERYSNGSTSATTEVTVSSGTLGPDEVMVIGGSDLQTYMTNNEPSVTFINDAFTFNGDDALELLYGGATEDVFGTIGVDPGSAWSGNGVSTANQNIQLLTSITDGDTNGWSDPSTRFETVSTDPNSTSSGGLDGFGQAPGALLPVDWVSFTAEKLHNKAVLLNWATANEENNSHFVIEHTTDARKWSAIGKVKAADEKQSVYKYDFVHKRPAKGVNYYRLRQVDIDGHQAYSSIQKVWMQESQYSNVTLYPNPVRDRLYIDNTRPHESNTFVIMDMNGRAIRSFNGALNEIPVHDLNTGMYILQITDESGTQQKRFVKR